MCRCAISLIITSVIVLLISACKSEYQVSSVILSVTPTSTSAPNQIATFEDEGPSPTLTPTNMNLDTTPFVTITPKLTQTELPKFTEDIQYQCLEIKTSLPNNHSLTGKLVLKSVDGREILDFNTGEKQAIMNDESVFTLNYFISPNRKLLAYEFFRKGTSNIRQIIVETSDNLQMAKFDIPALGFELRGWLDDEHLWFDKDRKPVYPEVVEPVSSVVVINPFTNERLELPPDFPGLIPSEALMREYFGISSVIYHPSLTFAVYPERSETGSYIVLWDMLNQKAVAKVRSYGGFQPTPPHWSPDGSWFSAVVDPYNDWDINTGELFHELIMVNIDGEERQLTHFKQLFKSAFIYYATSISPDGSKIAFSLSIDSRKDQGNYQLAILDLNTQKVTNYCIPVKYIISWSPDSKYLAVYDEDANRAILVSPQDEWAAVIAEKAAPMGWFDTP